MPYLEVIRHETNSAAALGLPRRASSTRVPSSLLDVTQETHVPVLSICRSESISMSVIKVLVPDLDFCLNGPQQRNNK